MKKDKIQSDVIQRIDRHLEQWKITFILVISLLGAILFVSGILVLNESELKEFPDSILLICIGGFGFSFFFPFQLCLQLVKSQAELKRKVNALEEALDFEQTKSQQVDCGQ